jgi:Zn-dependent M16 (insulinase) family peptidase
LRTEAALRIQERLERLSAAERVALGQRLQESVAEHQVSIPESLVPVCSGLLDPASISRFRVETIRIDDVGSGVRLQIDDVDSEFVRLTALLDTRGLSGRQRLLLPLFLETLFNTRVGERDHRAVRDALLADTVDYGCAIGLSKEGGDAGAGFAIGAFSQLISVTIKSERALYETCVHWLYDILYRSQLETNRVRIAAQKLLNDVAQHRRDGSALVAWLSNEVLYGANDEANIPAMAPPAPLVATGFEAAG